MKLKLLPGGRDGAANREGTGEDRGGSGTAALGTRQWQWHGIREWASAKLTRLSCACSPHEIIIFAAYQNVMAGKSIFCSLPKFNAGKFAGI